MNKQEAIRELMSKSREIIFGDDENVYLSRKRTIELVSQIDETQKVVVQKFVAEWIVSELSDLIDSCENDFEAIVFNPDGTFELLLACHAEFTHILKEATDDTEV